MDRIEKAARAMALADDRDPDQPIGRWQLKRIAGKTIVIHRYNPTLPCWNYYVPLAKLFVAAHQSLDEDRGQIH
jgi:hypothetical protein